MAHGIAREADAIMKRQPYYEADTMSYTVLSRQARERYDQAIEREYLVYKTSENASPLSHAFWDWFVRYGRPSVVVRKTPKKAIVIMDLLPIHNKDLGAGTPGYGPFAQELKETVEKYMGPDYFNKPGFCPGFFTQIKGVPLDQAEAMARDFLRIYSDHYDKEG
jgi:hypothetical protein